MKNLATKICSWCGVRKAFMAFYRCSSGTYGRYAYCKACSKIKNQKWKRENVEKVKEYERRSLKRRRAASALRWANTQSKHKLLPGDRFGMLRLLRPLGRIPTRREQRWIVACDCGVQKEVYQCSLISGRTRSCGSHRSRLVQLARRRHPTHGGFLAVLKHGAKRRGLPFELLDDEAVEMSKQNCYYCGSPPTERFVGGKWGTAAATFAPVNGIDRRRSDLGYTIANCVPCCRACNQEKSDQNEAEFLDRSRRRAVLHPHPQTPTMAQASKDTAPWG